MALYGNFAAELIREYPFRVVRFVCVRVSHQIDVIIDARISFT